MNRKQHFLKILGMTCILAVALPILAACGSPAAIVAQVGNQRLNICHATGNTTTPYEAVTLSLAEVVSHVDHKNDIIPAPVGGCPNAVQVGANNGQIAVCHATGDVTKPYSRVIVDINGLLTHINHPGDIISSPSSSCPTAAQALALTTTAIVTSSGTGTPTVATSTATPTLTVAPTLTETPNGTITSTAAPSITPGVTVTSTGTANATEAGKITICHATGSKKNPYVMITISVNGLNGHQKHSRDIIPAPAGGCPK